MLLTSTTNEAKEKLFCHGLGKKFACSNVGKNSSDLIKGASCALLLGVLVLFVCLFVSFFVSFITYKTLDLYFIVRLKITPSSDVSFHTTYIAKTLRPFVIFMPRFCKLKH